jgi:uncharacterized membrane-anchored protein YhcB (DUF1043 family)
MEGLKDIKDIVEVNDNSLWIFLGILFAGFVLIGVLAWLFKNRPKRRRKPTKRELAKERLKNLDFNDAKESVYRFLEDGELFLNQNNTSLYRELEKELEVYKYKRDIPPLNEETIKKIERFIGEIG